MNYKRDLAVIKETSKKLFDGIKHRGADDHGIYLDKRIILQHARLSIIDLKTGHQPMFNDSKSHLIVFNGEIFNFESIRTELISKGLSFQTKSDTEVLLKAYIEWGEDCLQKLNGFWAFCIYNLSNNTFFISRDRFGIKPLYFKKTNEEFIFASEIQAILNISTSTINTSEIWDEILFGSKNGGATTYNDIFELEPGTLLNVDLNTGTIKSKRYYDLYDHFIVPKEKLNLEQIDFLLKDSIRLRLISDVPLGTLNSGGLDSSYISAVVRKVFNVPLNTFSAAPNLTKEGLRKDGDESFFAELLAKYIGSNHHTIRYSDDEYFELLESVNNFDDSFLVHPNTVALYIMLKYIKDNLNIKVLLGGDGADELFRGYSNNTYANLLVKTSKIPIANKISANYFRKKFKKSIVSEIEGKFSLINCLSISHNNQRLNGNKITQILGISGQMSEDRIKLLEKSKSLSEYDQVIYYEQNCYLSGHFKRVDRTSMRAGIEVRLPFMDYRLVETMNRIHFNDKFGFGEKNKKKVLKKLGRHFLPEEIINRTKKGFSAPISHYRLQIEKYVSDKYKIKQSEFERLNNQELFILMNVLNKYQL